MKIKVCGLKCQSNIEELTHLPIDYMGFIFYNKSPRYLGEDLSSDFVKSIPKYIKKVGVFVNEDCYTVFNRIAHYDLAIVQLHGDETPEICAELKPHVQIMKAFQINKVFDFKQLAKYLTVVDYFLFDSSSANYGGSGKSFNWQILKNYTYHIPFFLSGGIGDEHAEELKQLKLPRLKAIDLNSKFETEPGLKNTEQIKQFIKKLNS
jgi:phosphoribosylanthranilate isomerase